MLREKVSLKSGSENIQGGGEPNSGWEAVPKPWATKKALSPFCCRLAI